MSWLLCLFFAGSGLVLSIPGLILARQDLKRIDRGESPPAGRTLAQIGFWFSLVNLILSGLALLVVILYLLFVVVLFGMSAAAG